jgi:hypothetical protein
MEQRVLISAEAHFPVPRKPSMPEFTAEDLHNLGVLIAETEETRLVEVPFLAQKKLVEAVQQFGFGTANALDALIGKILKLAGIEGKFEMSSDPKTFDWRAWQKKSLPAGDIKTGEPL